MKRATNCLILSAILLFCLTSLGLAQENLGQPGEDCLRVGHLRMRDDDLGQISQRHGHVALAFAPHDELVIAHPQPRRQLGEVEMRLVI